MTSGARNLVILGVVSSVIAVVTTGVSLAIYHNSGDIYLDRSRPGYLPGEDEIEQGGGEDDGYRFDERVEVTNEVLDEYLKEFAEEVEAVDAYGDAFGAGALSDKELGIE